MVKDINFVMSTGHRGWAIDALTTLLLKKLPDFQSRKIEIPQSRRHVRSPRGIFYLPRANVHFFMQQDLLVHCLDRKWVSKEDQIIVRYTHNNRSMSLYRDAFEIAKFITVENSRLKEEMIKLGVERDKISFLPHPIKWESFNNVRSKGKSRDVIFVSNFYARKRPDIVSELVFANPSLLFTVLGKKWDLFPRFDDLIKLPNFEYQVFDYKQYPRVLAEHKVFCSVSDVEGGPVPLLESLTAGLVPVVTDTGYARDVIPSELIKYIVPISPRIDVLSRKIHLALTEEEQSVDTRQFGEEKFLLYITDLVRSCIE